MQVIALLAQRKIHELKGRAETDENLAGERKLQINTAARVASKRMFELAEEKLAPSVEIFAKSASVCDTMSEVAVKATSAVIENHRAKVAGLQKKEGEHLMQHFDGVCSAFSGMVEECVFTKNHCHEAELKLRGNAVVLSEARRLRRGKHALAGLRAKKLEIAEEKEQHVERLVLLDTRMAQLKDSDAFAKTCVRIGELTACRSDGRHTSCREAVGKWVTAAVPPAAPWTELEETFTEIAEEKIRKVQDDKV